MGVIDQILSVESGGDPNASNPRSSALGSGQFIASTWLDTISRHRPDLVQGKSQDEILAMRTDPALSREMTGALASDNAAALTRAGVPVTDGSSYLAHFAGAKGAVGLLNADPSTPAGSIMGAAAVKANPFLAKMTAGDVAAWADRKMGGAAAPMAMAGPSLQKAQTAPEPSAPSAPVSAEPAPARQPAFQIGGSGGSPAPDMAALTATPVLRNILSARPNPLGMKLAPFSFARG